MERILPALCPLRSAAGQEPAAEEPERRRFGLIRIEDLSVAFGDTEVVRHVDLELSGGEILGVVGESGSGKSLTALTLMGLSADSARVTTGRCRRRAGPGTRPSTAATRGPACPWCSRSR